MLVVAVSQSGESHEIIEASRVALERGASLLAVTNTEWSPLTAMVDERASVLRCMAGTEVAIPATKSVTTAMACLLGLALSGDHTQLVRTAAEVPRLLRSTLAEDASGVGLAGLDAVILTGEGAGAAVAEEGAIKFREIAQIPAAALELSEFLHGSINSARPGVAVITLALDGLSSGLAQQVVDAAANRGAHTISIGRPAVDGASRNIALLEAPPAWGAFLALARVQELARSTGLARGVAPDRPPGLTKVTVIEGEKG
jgi:glutamine---fructose-6-phosphate transaminase (isomerizing)